MERLEECMERKRLEVNTEENDHEVQEGGEVEWRGTYGDEKEESWRK